MTAYLEWFEDYFIIQYEDVLTLEQTAVLYSDILAKENFQDIKFGIVNTSNLIEVKYDDYDFNRHAALTVVAEQSLGLKALKVGVVVTNPIIALYVKKLKEKVKIHNHSWDRQLFPTIEEAMSWCKS